MTVMRCIFCKQNSDSCVSVEHIIPESLGNVEHILPKSWVCDSCNNYLSHKVEKPFLESNFGRYSRFEMHVPNKKGRVPSVFGFHAQSRTKIELMSSEEGLCIGAAPGEDEANWVASVKKNSHGSIYIPVAELPEADYVTSRFIGKIAMEVLAHRCLDIEGWNEELVGKLELDELRNYVRFGKPNLVWPVSIRRIYPQDIPFVESSETKYQVLHEFKIFVTPAEQYYVVIAIFGVEFAINLGSPEIIDYIKWLENNHNQSPLYDKLPT